MPAPRGARARAGHPRSARGRRGSCTGVSRGSNETPSRRVATAAGDRVASSRPGAPGFYVLPSVGACCLALLLLASCGAGGAGAGPAGVGGDLVLLSFNVDALDNVPLNRVLELRFSADVDPSSVDTGSIQIRSGPAFGSTVRGRFQVDGGRVLFEPVLPGLRRSPGDAEACESTTAGLAPDTSYRVTIVGHPEASAVRGTRGQVLEATSTAEFRTRTADDPRLLEDADPQSAPSVVRSTPQDGAARVRVGSALKVGDGAGVRYEGTPDRVEIAFSENVDPCSIDGQSLVVAVHEQGEARDGFVPEEDADPADPHSWGAPAATRLAPPLHVPCALVLEQDFERTLLTLTPAFGRFPENALVVVDLGAGIRDFGGTPLVPKTVAFTTENKPPSSAALRVEYDDSTPIDPAGRTAQVHLPLAPSKAQGFVNVAGDGDNGPDILLPAFPTSIAPPLCEAQPNDAQDHFDPDLDVVLDTGASPNTCRNGVDGSYAVVWEFASFTIRDGVTVTLAGVNPAIILVSGPVTIRPAGTLRLAGQAGEPGISSSSAYGLPWPRGAGGGQGVAGGGRGGDSQDVAEVHPNPDGAYGADGWSGYGSPSHPAYAEGGVGAGEGNAAAGYVGPPPTFGTSSGAGGGGGHGDRGADGGSVLGQSNGWLAAGPRGAGGSPYPTVQDAQFLLQPSAGSGGGAAGYCDCVATAAGHRPGCTASGGAGGGGGGFVDITSGASIRIQGTIDASGGWGGNGGVSYYVDIGDTGGGGGGSGGGIRLLTPGEIDVAGAVITTAGGVGGVGTVSTMFGGAPPNHGGAGSNGRVVLEDADGVIAGQTSATIVPSEGEPGFYRGPFRETRFGGGARTVCVATRPMRLGPLSAPRLRTPVAGDFVAGVPAGMGRGLGATAILVEIQGHPLAADGRMVEAAGSGWWTVGHFRDTGAADAALWVAGLNPGDVVLPPDNLGAGIDRVGAMGFVQVRLTFYLGEAVGVGSAGPFVDRFDLRFEYDDL